MPPILPRALHRLALRLAQVVRLRWWRLTGARKRGCNVIARNAAGEVLLVRHTYEPAGGWMLPGGGMKAGEDPLDTARRELREETGCRLDNAALLFTDVVERSGWTNTIDVVGGGTCDAPVPDGREIAEARFFAPGALPAGTNRLAAGRIARALEH